jgi:protein-glutamine gamma-glutamyltransferase
MSGLATRPRDTGTRERSANGAANGASSGPPSGVVTARSVAPPPYALELRLAAFAALALFATAHWLDLVTDPPGRLLLLVGVATGGGALLAQLNKVPGRARFPLAALVVLVTLVAGFFVVGLDPKLLAPRRLDDLLDGIDRGLAGVQTVDWPYAGDDPWIRLTILLGAPLLLGIAAGLTFWPVRNGGAGLRGAGLVMLVLLYGTAVTEHDVGKPIWRGFVLLLLVAAWLWLPRLQPREALAGAGAVVAIGILAIPFSIKLDGSKPWWDYRSFDWFAGGKTVTFDWTHSYGPLDWPRDGTTLLNVRSPRPHYWKAETLDTFDGYRWERSGFRTREATGRREFGELPLSTRREGKTWNYFEYNPAWDTSFRVTVRGLRSDLIIGAGSTYRVIGAGTNEIASDGTAVKLTDPLEKGDSYTVQAYVPTPTADQMRGAPQEYTDVMRNYTAVFVPRPGDGTLPGGTPRFQRGRSSTRPEGALFAPLRGAQAAGSPRARQQLLSSPYARVYRLARRLTDGQPTVYDAADSIRTYLKRTYRYDERPPVRSYPLAAFLFQDKRGYCQQFSGAMALMLRMAGIPARVATGFTRGSYNADTREYRIRDLDAHSWVEVNFTGIGWVAFDPTPATTPAVGQTAGIDTGASSFQAPGNDSGRSGAVRQTPDNGKAAAGSSGGLPVWLIALGATLLAAIAAAGVAALRAARARRGRPAGRRAELQLGELRGALTRLGWTVPTGTTLLALERRLRRAAGPAAAGYAAGLRANRYDPGSPEPPGTADRRAMRRELGSHGGLRGRLRALLAIPPWGPRAR